MKQVLDIEQMQHLQELGLDTSNASMLHCELYDEKPILVESKHKFHKVENAIILDGVRSSVIYCKKVTYVYTLQDVLELLPKELELSGERCWLRMDLSDECIYYYYEDCNLIEQRVVLFNGGEDIDLLEAAYRMLYWCIKQGYVKTDKEGEGMSYDISFCTGIDSNNRLCPLHVNCKRYAPYLKTSIAFKYVSYIAAAFNGNECKFQIKIEDEKDNV